MHVCFNNSVCAWQQPRAVSAAPPLPGLGAQSLLLPSSQSTWRSTALRQLQQLHQPHRVGSTDRWRCGAGHCVAEGRIAMAVVAGYAIGLMRVHTAFVVHAGERAGQWVHAPAGGAGPAAGTQLVFLRIGAMLEIAAARAVHGEAQAAVGHQRAGVQDHPQAGIAQHHVEVIVAARLGALALQVCADRLRHAEQLQRLVQQMRPQVVPQPGAGDIAFAPAVAHLRAIPVEVRMELHHLAQLAVFDQAPHGEEVRIPTAVLEHADDLAGLCGGVHHGASLCGIQGEGFIHQHVLAGRQCLQRHGRMGLVGRGDDHRIQRRVGQCSLQVGQHAHLAEVRLRLLRLGRHHAVQLQAGRAGDQRCVEGAANIAIADDGQIEWFRH